MYNEEIAKTTAQHLRTHIKAYLDEVNSAFTGTDKVTLGMPKIDTRSMVGGALAGQLDDLPLYVIDLPSKALSQVGENLYTYQYTGHIGGLVSAGSQEAVDKLAKRHMQAIELFVKRHLYLHQATGSGFILIGLEFTGSDLTGAELVEEENKRQIWLGGFIVNCLWTTSEDGPRQHA